VSHAIVAHHYWNRAGGGQLVCAATAKALELMGFQPVLASTARVDVSRYPEWFGLDLSKYPRVDLGIELRAFGIYLRLLVGQSIRKALRRYPADIVFTDECTYKGVSDIVRREGIKLIEYIHFPVEVSFRREFSGTGVYYGEDPYVVERYGRFPMNLYYRFYLKLLPTFLRDNPFDIASLVLTNSRWTAELAKRVYGREPAVLNPPIPPNVEVVREPRPFEVREDAVVMVGRFSEEKRYHWVIGEVLPRLREEVPSAKLYVFGATGTRTSRAYYGRLLSLASRAGFKVSGDLGAEADVYLVENAPRGTINEVLDRARAFLHATVNEHWGVAVAEAMARGVPVVVHRSGGTWSDLVSEGSCGLGYTSAEEAAEALAKLLTDPVLWRYYSGRAVERVSGLTLDRFTERFSELLRRLG
jgi:glycosyltransferase involved in cell wall biosynthesis